MGAEMTSEQVTEWLTGIATVMGSLAGPMLFWMLLVLPGCWIARVVLEIVAAGSNGLVKITALFASLGVYLFRAAYVISTLACIALVGFAEV